MGEYSGLWDGVGWSVGVRGGGDGVGWGNGVGCEKLFWDRNNVEINGLIWSDKINN